MYAVLAVAHKKCAGYNVHYSDKLCKSDKTYGKFHPMSRITSGTTYFYIVLHIAKHVVVGKCQSAHMYTLQAL